MTHENDNPDADARVDATPETGSVQEDKPHVRWRAVRWALAEIGVVTVGILIAFSLEAWWDDRRMVGEEQVHLRALASDFEKNIKELERLIEQEERTAASTEILLDRSLGRDVAPAESVGQLMSDVFTSARYEPVMGAYEALVNSAGLTLIQDDSLRASLASFAAQVSNRYAESWSNEHYFAFAREFGGTVVLGLRESGEQPDRRLEELLHDPGFQAHLAMRYNSAREMARRYRELQQQAVTVLARVRGHIRD